MEPKDTISLSLIKLLLPFAKKVTPKLPLDCASCKLSQKSSGSPEIPSLRSVSFRFLFAFLLVLKRCARIAASMLLGSGLRLVSVKKLSFLSRPEGKFFMSDPPAGGEFEKLGEESEVLAGGSWPAVWLMRLLTKVEKTIMKNYLTAYYYLVYSRKHSASLGRMFSERK